MKGDMKEEWENSHAHKLGHYANGITSDSSSRHITTN